MRTAALLIAVAMALWATHGRWWTVPDRHNPWAPLALDEPPGWLTRHKLERLEHEPGACRAFVEAAGFRFTPVPPRTSPEGCGWADALRLSRTADTTLALWERHVLHPAAQAHLGTRVARIEHYGSYACRNVYGRDTGSLSRHARADALDVAGVVLADGRRIRVAADWRGSDPEAAFLRALHAGACGVFDTVLGPEYNAAHADHLHLDRGPYRVCR